MENLTGSEIEALRVIHYLSLISFTLLVYEYCITFSLEVERFWCSRLNWASFLFYLNRYFSLFGHIPVMVQSFLYSSASSKAKVCEKLQSYHQYFSIAVQVVITSLLIMRIYALYERSCRVLAFFIGVTIVVLVIGCWLLVSGKSHHGSMDHVALVGCPAPLSRPEALRLGAAWSGLLVIDSLVFGMTVYKSLSMRRRSGINLIDLLLRDGSIYFSVMIAATVGNILTFMYGEPFTRGVATSFMNSISSVMITRLMLNLRGPMLEGSITTPTDPDDTIQFMSTFVDPRNGTEITGHGQSENLNYPPNRQV